MTCKLDSFLLQEYLDGTIDPLEKILLDEHLKECLLCRKELTEYKLLMWELEGFNEVEIPLETATMRTNTLNHLMASSQSNSNKLKEFAAQQKNILQNTGLFLEAVPGLKSSIKAMEKGLKKTPSALYKLLSGGLKTTKKLSALRERL